MRGTRTVGAYEAKTNLSSLLDYVVEGNDVVITRHERPVARLVPVGAAAAGAEAFERLRALRSCLKLARGESAADLIAEGRRI